MSQHDMDIANAAGASFRADLNLALAALVGLSSGTAAPGTLFANMLWIDTTNSLAKKRNNANGAWQTFASMDFGVWLLGDGAVGAPAYSFSGDTDCGLYRIGANNIGLAVNGTKMQDISTAGTSFTGTVTAATGVDITGTGAGTRSFWLRGGGIASFYDGTATEIGRIQANAGNFSFSLPGGGDYLFTSHGTTASAANAFLNSGTGALQRSTSLEETKDIKGDFPLVDAKNVILNNRWFTYTSKIKTDDQEKVFVGTGARGLFGLDKRFVHYEEDEPSGVQYERFVVPLAVMMKDHEARLAALEAR